MDNIGKSDFKIAFAFSRTHALLQSLSELLPLTQMLPHPMAVGATNISGLWLAAFF